MLDRDDGMAGEGLFAAYEGSAQLMGATERAASDSRQ